MTTKNDPLMVTMRDDTRPDREERLKALWEQLLAQNPTNKDLLDVIHTMESFASAAYDELLKRQPSNDEIISCFFCKDSSVHGKASEFLLARLLALGDLVELVKWGQGRTADIAWARLLDWDSSSTVNNEYFRRIVEMNPNSHQKFRPLAAAMLLKKNPSNSDLISIMEHCSEELAEEAMSLFDGKSSTKEDLCSVLRKVRHDRVVMRGMALILTHTHPDNDMLVLVITTHTKVYKWQRKAFDLLMERNPTKEQLQELIRRIPDGSLRLVWDDIARLLTNEDLLEVINSSPVRVAEEILRRPNTSRTALRTIIDRPTDVYKEIAARILLEDCPNEEELQLIYTHVSALSAEVLKRLPKKSVTEIIRQMRTLGA